MSGVAQDLESSAPQVAGRALVVQDNRLLLVNGDGDGTFWTTPGGRSNLGEDIKTCVRREVYEETGLHVDVGPMIAVTEFFDPALSFHVMQAHFICTLTSGTLNADWKDQGGPVQKAHFFTLDELAALPRVFPEFLKEGAWQQTTDQKCFYKGFERR